MEDTLILYLHILSATLLVGSSVASRLARRVVLGAADLASLRAAAEVVRCISLANPGLAIILLASGLYLGSVGFWHAAWFWAAVAAWLINSLLAVGVVGPAGRRLGLAAAGAGDGTIPADVAALRRARAPAVAADVMIGLDLAVLLLMIAKPAAALAILCLPAGVGLMLMLGLADAGLAARRAGAGTAA